jgi:hypothetical protein
MKKLLLIATLFAIISCKNESREPKLSSAKIDSLSVGLKPISADTIFFTYDKKWKGKDIALVYLLAKKYTKDSVCTGTFKIDFKDHDKITFSKTFKIKGINEGSQWFGSLELDSIASPLKSVGYGYPACGYGQSNLLFYVNGSNSDLIHRWDSGGDSGWGNWSEVVSGEPEDFYFRSRSFLPSDSAADDEEMGVDEYSDSIHFKLENRKWKKTYQTPKGKIYRSKIVSFDTFYKQG